MARFGRGFPMPTVRPISAITYDATGAGNAVGNVTNPSLSWTHTVGNNASIILVGVSIVSAATSGSTISGTVGGNAMTVVANPFFGLVGNGSYANLAILSLTNPPSGSQTISITATTGGANLGYVAANSVSYRGVFGLGSAVTAGGTSSSTATQTVTTAPPPGWIFNVMSNFNVGTFSSYTKRSRYNVGAVAYVNAPTLIGDANGGSPSVTFSASNGGTGNWWSAAVPMIA